MNNTLLLNGACRSGQVWSGLCETEASHEFGCKERPSVSRSGSRVRGTELGCRAPQEPCCTGAAQLTQPLLCSMWAVLGAVAPGHHGHDYLFGNSGFYLKYLPCSFIYYFFFVTSYHCIALQAAVKNFFSFTDLSLPFRFSGFYLHRGDPWKSLAVPFISPVQKLQYRYTLCLHHSIGWRGEFCHCIFHSLIMIAPI